MAQLNPSIILAGTNPDLMGAFDRGQQAGERGNQIGTQNALRSLYQTQGAGIASGDQGALNALAAIDPMASLGVQGQRQQMQARTQQMEMLTREEARQVQDRAASLSAAERAAQAQQIEQSVRMGLGATSPQQWDQMMQQVAPELVGQFEQREMLANRFMSIADILKRQDGPSVPPAVQTLQWRAQQAGLKPGSPEYQAFIASGDAPKITNTFNAGAGGPGADEEELRKKLGGAEGTQWAAFLDQGAKAAGMQQDMEILNEIITMAPQGPLEGRLANAFPGMNSAADAFNSIVKRLAPTMRAEGSGSTSDIEYDGMLRSLPQLANRPEANQAIAGMIQAKAQVNMERAQVVAAYQNGEIDLTTARRSLGEINKRSIMSPELKALIGGLAPAAAPANDYSGMSDDEIRKELGL